MISKCSKCKKELQKDIDELTRWFHEWLCNECLKKEEKKYNAVLALINYNQPMKGAVKITTQEIADRINQNCEEAAYFWAIGLLKKTISLWRAQSSFQLLCMDAQTIAIHYLTKG